MKNYEQLIINAENEVKRLKKLKEEEEKMAKMSPSERLAIFIHNNMCSKNHLTQCSWCHEIKNGKHDWTEISHLRYITIADFLLEFMDEEESQEVVISFKGC